MPTSHTKIAKGATMDYHLFQRKTVKKNGKISKQWYYWYEVNHVRKQKVCKNCRNKAEAMAFISTLPERDTMRSVAQIAREMFIPGGAHVERMRQLGKPLSVETLKSSRFFVDAIVSQFGAKQICDIDVREIYNYLILQNRSGSWKSHYISVFKKIYEEAAWQGVKVAMPIFPKFAKNPKPKSIFSTDELKRLFVQKNFEGNAFDSESCFLFFLIILLAGLRQGEARALRPKQFIFEKNALVIDGFCKQDGTRTNFNKTGSEENTKSRIVILPGETMQMVSTYICTRRKNSDDFLFAFSGKPLSREYVGEIFRKALKKSGIDTNGKNFSPHSLRYTYVTRMRRYLSGETVQKLVGHADVAMTDYYTKFSLESGLAGIAESAEAVERLFL